jgi:ABC-type antimicrobial peptide transport system permease subunit
MHNFRLSFRNFWKVFRRSRMGLVGAFLLITMLFVAVFGPLLTPYTYPDYPWSQQPSIDLCAALSASVGNR